MSWIFTALSCVRIYSPSFFLSFPALSTISILLRSSSVVILFLTDVNVDLCCYSAVTYEEIAAVIYDYSWSKFNLTFKTAVCAIGGDSNPV